MDGLPCQNNAAYCYEGRCQTYDYQCGHLFAPGTSNTNSLLFSVMWLQSLGKTSQTFLVLFSGLYFSFWQIMQLKQQIFVSKMQIFREIDLVTVEGAAKETTSNVL